MRIERGRRLMNERSGFCLVAWLVMNWADECCCKTGLDEDRTCKEIDEREERIRSGGVVGEGLVLGNRKDNNADGPVGKANLVIVGSDELD